jgi:hypothetical protein
MLISRQDLRTLLLHVLSQRLAQGADLDEPTLRGRIDAAADSYDGLADLAAVLRRAGEAVGEWPLRDDVSEEFLAARGRRHDSWRQTTRGNLRFAVADDDLHYTLRGLLVLEWHGTAFTHDDLYHLWGRIRARHGCRDAAGV